jgi:hypothetical protein
MCRLSRLFLFEFGSNPYEFGPNGGRRSPDYPRYSGLAKAGGVEQLNLPAQRPLFFRIWKGGREQADDRVKPAGNLCDIIGVHVSLGTFWFFKDT